MEGQYKNIRMEIKNNENITEEKLLNSFLYRIDFRKNGCCCVETYDYTNNSVEIKFIVETIKQLEKPHVEIYLNINLGNGIWADIVIDDELLNILE